MGRRTLLLIASILVAAVGTGLVAVYVRNADNRVQRGQELVQVHVAKSKIPAGITGAAAIGSTEPVSVTLSSLTPGAIGNLTVIRELVVLADIYPGQQIIQSQFGSAAATPAGASGLRRGKLAVGVQLTDTARVASVIRPGSIVAIFVSVDDVKTQLLYSGVRVMGVGAVTTAPASTGQPNAPQTEGVTSALVTLELDPIQAPNVIYASTYQQVSLSVLGDGNPTPPGGEVDARNLFG